MLGVCFIPIYMGIMGKTAGVEAVSGSSVLMAVSIALTNPVISALMGCAILAAIISTADSLINAISSNLTQDFNLPLGRKKVLVSRCITAVIAISGILVSAHFNNVVDILILSYELSISCLFVSVFAAMMRGKGEKLSAVLSILLGALGFFLFRAYPMEYRRDFEFAFISQRLCNRRMHC